MKPKIEYVSYGLFLIVCVIVIIVLGIPILILIEVVDHIRRRKEYREWNNKCKSCYYGKEDNIKCCAHAPCEECRFGSLYLKDSPELYK